MFVNAFSFTIDLISNNRQNIFAQLCKKKNNNDQLLKLFFFPGIYPGGAVSPIIKAISPTEGNIIILKVYFIL